MADTSFNRTSGPRHRFLVFNPSTSVRNSVFVPRVWAREHEWGNEQYTYRKFVMRRCRTMSCFLPGVPAIVHADPRKLTLSDILSYRVVAEVIAPRVSGRDQTPAETGKWCTYDTVGILYASRSLTFDDTAVASTSGVCHCLPREATGMRFLRGSSTVHHKRQLRRSTVTH